MFTLRCTRKLLRRLAVPPTSEAVAPTTVLGDWYANLLYVRPRQLVLAMSERSLLCVVVPASPADDLPRRLRASVAELLAEIGVPAGAVSAEVQAMETMAVGATASRAILGCMNDAVIHLQLSPRGRTGESKSPLDIARYLAENIYSLNDYQKPWIRALELFGLPADRERVRPGRWVH